MVHAKTGRARSEPSHNTILLLSGVSKLLDMIRISCLVSDKFLSNLNTMDEVFHYHNSNNW